MRGDIPFPGSTRAKLIDVGLRLFSTTSYEAVDVATVAEEAGVTVGALYHHFRSKQGFYGVLRDEMTQRLVDRIEAAADVSPTEGRIQIAVIAAYNGLLRIKAGKLVTEPDPRGTPDALATALGHYAEQAQRTEPALLGAILAAAVRAAWEHSGTDDDQQERVRRALQHLVQNI